MNYTSIFAARARKEISAAWEWYEDRQSGLGRRFREELNNRIFEIEQDPERYPKGKPPYRQTLMNVFPYLIIYKISKRKQEILIYSVFHAKRNPSTKYGSKRN